MPAYTLWHFVSLEFSSSTNPIFFQTNPKAIQESRFKDLVVQNVRLGNLNLSIILSLCGFGRCQQQAWLNNPQNRYCKAVFIFESCHALCGKLYARTECFESEMLKFWGCL